MSNSFSARATLSVAGQRYEIFRLRHWKQNSKYPAFPSP